MYTIFFDHYAYIGPWNGLPVPPVDDCRTKVTLDNISSMDGTSMTILLTENEDAGNWIWERNIGTGFFPGNIVAVPCAGDHADPNAHFVTIESEVGFCYPNVFTSSTTVYEEPDYTRNVAQPLFINEGRSNSGGTWTTQQTTRPSSGHPGVIIAAFCDGSVRPLKDDMDRTLFVRLCRPGSGVILNPKDLD
jgi:hypothetical protein